MFQIQITKFHFTRKQRSAGEDSTKTSSDGKATKRRRSEDFDYFQRSEHASKDTNKDIFARVQRTDTVTKDGEWFCLPVFLSHNDIKLLNYNLVQCFSVSFFAF